MEPSLEKGGRQMVVREYGFNVCRVLSPLSIPVHRTHRSHGFLPRSLAAVSFGHSVPLSLSNLFVVQIIKRRRVLVCVLSVLLLIVVFQNILYLVHAKV